MPNVLEILQATTLEVEAVPNWETRRGSRYSFDHNPGGTLGMIVHHTAAGGSADMPCRNICVNGRSDLKGPLVQFLVGRSGKVLLISQNRCNHAGRGSGEVKKDLEASRDSTTEFDAGQGAYDARNLGRGDDFKSGNRVYWGVEIENNGIGEEYGADQMQAVIELCAAICRWQGWDHNRIIHHREHSQRKYDMSYRGPLRDMVRDALTSDGRNPWQIPDLASLGGNPRGAPKASEEPGLLKMGDNGGDVIALQKALTTLGYILVVDGDFGAGTRAAVMRFQKKNKLRATGSVDQKCWAALRMRQNRPIVSMVQKPYAGLLRQGDRGPNVRWLQEQLGISVDGVFGRGTKAALKSFQQKHRLKADGICGRITWTALTGSDE